MGGSWVLDPLQYIKTDPCCLIFNAQGHHFHPSVQDRLHLKTKPHLLSPGLHTAPSAAELSNILPAPNHGLIAIHLSPRFVALFLLTRFALFFFFPSKVTKLSPQGHLELQSSTGFTRQEPGSGWATASAASINLLAHSSLSQTHRKNDISISFERRCREIGKSMGPIDFQYVCSLPPGINTTAKSIGITSYQLSNLFCS